MRDTTREAILAIVRADLTTTKAEREAIAAALSGKPAQAQAQAPMDRVLSRQEAARLLNVRPHTITDYARAGRIRAVRCGRKAARAVGYSAASVQALIGGATNG